MKYLQYVVIFLNIFYVFTKYEINLKRSIFEDFLIETENKNNFEDQNRNQKKEFCKKHIDIFSKSSNERTDSNCVEPPCERANVKLTDTNKKLELKNERNSTDIMNRFKRIKLPNIQRMKVGEEKHVILSGDIEAKIKVLSVNPFIFEVENFIDAEDCELLIDLAKSKKLKPIMNVVPEVQLKNAESTFQVWDYNQDGFLSFDEITLLPVLSGINFTVDDADDMFFLLRMDKNNDKMISLEELRNTDFSQLKAYFTRLQYDEIRQRNLASEGSWVWHDHDELLKYNDEGYFEEYHNRISDLTGLPKEIIEESEPLQIRHFVKGQFQFARHDSEPITKDLPCCLYGDVGKMCRLCRYISMSIFLNDEYDGGEVVFPLANTKYQNVLDNSGEWRGYFIYAKTTGNKFYFQVNVTLTLSGVNRVFSADGKDESGDFVFKDGIIIDDTVKFEKVYNSDDSNNGIKYQGKLSDGNKISGYWWIPGQKRLRGTFFMWNKEYDIFSSKAIDFSNTIDGCTKSSLVIQPKLGKAIFWYNHELNPRDGMVGEFNQESMYAQCELRNNEKWVASTWINVIGDGDLELRAWRRGNNFLTDSQRKLTSIFQKLGTNETKLPHESYESEYLQELTGRNLTTHDDLEGYYKHKPASNSLQALQLLMNDMTMDQLKLLASNVHKKLGLTCIPMGVVGGGSGR